MFPDNHDCEWVFLWGEGEMFAVNKAVGPDSIVNEHLKGSFYTSWAPLLSVMDIWMPCFSEETNFLWRSCIIEEFHYARMSLK